MKLVLMPVKQTIKVKIKKVVPLVFAILCLIPYLSFASGPPVLVQGTATGTTQIRLSTVDGTAFIDGDGTVPCTSFIGEKLEIVDSAGKKISGFVKAAGDGEDLSVTEKFTDPIYENDAAWTIGSGWTVNAAASGKAEATTSTANLTEAISLTAGGLYKLVTNCDALTGGTYQAIIEATNIGTAVNTTAAVSWYRTVAAATAATNGTKATTSLSATFTGISLKQATGPSATGCTIVSTKDGATYNWNIKESGFNPNSTTFKYRIISTNIPGKQIASGTVSATDVKLATVDGGAMVEITGVDLSPYAGNDTGGPVTIINPKSTSAATMTTNKYLLALYDSSGRVATGYIGASGGGETLSGVELMTNGDMETGDPPTGWTVSRATLSSSSGGQSGNCARMDSTSNYSPYLERQLTGLLSGQLVKNTWYAKSSDWSESVFYLSSGVNTAGNYFIRTPVSPSVASDWSVQNALYFTLPNTALYFLYRESHVSGTYFGYLDSISLQQVTDIATIGIHLHSTPNATDRKMSLKTTGFDPNAVTSYKIYRVY